MMPLVELHDVDVDSPSGRPLMRGLNLSLSAGDRVALIGRNGVGKSTLLALLARHARGRVAFVEQEPSAAQDVLERLRGRELAIAYELEAIGLRSLRRLLEQAQLSRGERRKLCLVEAKLARPELLLLDEPTQDLDAAGEAWLQQLVAEWSGAMIVASHSRALLRGFEHFFIVAESGCRYVPGRFDELQRKLEQEAEDRQRKHIEHLNALAQEERHHLQVCQRRARKKNVGRLHELRRCTSRMRLNEKRSYAQESQAKAARIRAQRIESARGWAKATRVAMTVRLPLDALVTKLPEHDGEENISLRGVGMEVGDRVLFEGVEVGIGRERVAVTGPNGSGKTTLLRIMLGEISPTRGDARCRRERIGVIGQGAGDWALEDSLLSQLAEQDTQASLDAAAQLLLAHRFPLALAERPMASLSPGERVRAALICLYRRSPAVEVLVLDEPTLSLDFVGLAALTEALRAWPGGLVVASHDREFLDAIGIGSAIELDGLNQNGNED